VGRRVGIIIAVVRVCSSLLLLSETFLLCFKVHQVRVGSGAVAVAAGSSVQRTLIAISLVRTLVGGGLVGWAGTGSLARFLGTLTACSGVIVQGTCPLVVAAIGR